MKKSRMCLVVLIGTLSGCGSDGISSLSDTERAAVGIYALASVSGSSVPFQTGTKTQGDCPIFIDGGGFELSNDRSYEAWFNIRAVCPKADGGTESVADEVRQQGQWKIEGTTLQLTRDKVSPGSSYNWDSDPTIQGNTVTATVAIEWMGTLPRLTAVFRK